MGPRYEACPLRPYCAYYKARVKGGEGSVGRLDGAAEAGKYAKPAKRKTVKAEDIELVVKK